MFRLNMHQDDESMLRESLKCNVLDIQAGHRTVVSRPVPLAPGETHPRHSDEVLHTLEPLPYPAGSL